MASHHFKRHLIHQAIIQRSTQTQSASGELIDSWTDVATIDCRFIRKGQRIASEGVGFMVLETDRLLCDYDEDLNEEDRAADITFKADGSTVDSGPFTVEEKLIRNSTRAHHMSLRLERVE